MQTHYDGHVLNVALKSKSESFTFAFKNFKSGAGEMARVVKCLVCTPEGLHLTLSAHSGKLGAFSPGVGEQDGRCTDWPAFPTC